MVFSDVQLQRLQSLGAHQDVLQRQFADVTERNSTFQKVELELVTAQKEKLNHFISTTRQPRILALEEKLSKILRTHGFIQVHTPLLLTKNRLAKMGIDEQSPMYEQVFWLDNKRCLRPMLAPHLYEYMLDLGKLLPKPLRLFEIGPCFRKETQGAKHSNEFTMLNLVEMGLPKDTDFTARLKELGALVLQEAGIEQWQMMMENSAVYGDANDFVDKNGMELASSAIGPLPMDDTWRIHDNWVGIGFGLERLVMSAGDDTNLAKTGRTLSYLDGIALHL